MIGGNILQEEIAPIPLGECIAKTANEKPGISVENHCLVVGLIAQELIALFPDEIRTGLFPDGTGFVAACHDIGKISPAFQKMIYNALPSCFNKHASVFSKVNADNAGRRTPGFHAAVSQVSLSGSAKCIPEILGIHHGFSPVTNNTQKGCVLHGGNGWQAEREKIVDRLRELFSCPNGFWPSYTETQAGVVSGLVTVADWIGSGDFFGGYTLDDVLPHPYLETKAKEAVAAAGFHKIRVRHGLSFTDVFPFYPNSIQNNLMQAANRPGVYILEAPMGIGKTEAALYAAYLLLEKEAATGIYFALPTQLTSEKIHERLGRFLDRILDPASGLDRAYLLHGSAWLQETAMGEDADAGGSWFDSSKRGILAPFAAGTIDQALMAVMNVRHGFVRAFGLAGKVVILDEVHSYDAFTGTIINRLVDELCKIHCTVIILSATLTESQRRTLLALDRNIQLSAAYPLVSALGADTASCPEEIACSSESEARVAISCTADSDGLIATVLDRASTGEQVLWIENTVADAQDVFKQLSARSVGMNVDCGLLHSRFIKGDREEKEASWVSLYGKDGIDKRKEKGHILVGTQVLEQSIDIDADYLVSRLCPTDMLLQRIGRLWRHRMNDGCRPAGARRQVTIIAPLCQDAAEKPRQFGKSGAVYSEYVLIRTLEIWSKLTSIVVPDDIRSLIETDLYCQ